MPLSISKVVTPSITPLYKAGMSREQETYLKMRTRQSCGLYSRWLLPCLRDGPLRRRVRQRYLHGDDHSTYLQVERYLGW